MVLPNNGKTLLVIDDEFRVQNLIRAFFKVNGYRVETAGNGREGLERLETLAPDLIILDMNMPEMGGLEFYQKICYGTDRPKYPVLVLTGRVNMEDLLSQLNVDGFMIKPVEMADLLREVEAIIENRSKVVVRESRKKVCIVENNPGTLQQIAAMFLAAGYMVSAAQNAAEGITCILDTQPDVALVSLGLADMPGDMVILKAKLLLKANAVKYILYTEETLQKTDVPQKIGEKSVIDRFVKYLSLQELFLAADEVLKK